MWPEWVTEALRQGGLLAVAVICLAWSTVFFRMWRLERDINLSFARGAQDAAAADAKGKAELAAAITSNTHALQALADEVQRTREEQLRHRLEGRP